MEGRSEGHDHSPVCLEMPGSAQSAIRVLHRKPFADKGVVFGIVSCDGTEGKYHDPASCEHQETITIHGCVSFKSGFTGLGDWTFCRSTIPLQARRANDVRIEQKGST